MSLRTEVDGIARGCLDAYGLIPDRERDAVLLGVPSSAGDAAQRMAGSRLRSAGIHVTTTRHRDGWELYCRRDTMSPRDAERAASQRLIDDAARGFDFVAADLEGVDRG